MITEGASNDLVIQPFIAGTTHQFLMYNIARNLPGKLSTLEIGPSNTRRDDKGKQPVQGGIDVLIEDNAEWATSNSKRKAHLRSIMSVVAPLKSTRPPFPSNSSSLRQTRNKS
ncbi:hypothetical protein J1N35_008901 [Gossypium stocksii]|uniref:Uncharacterized protein n=1 Tax=Gossypium stocksii TaxID=47602 RepID=A0A9D3WA61_9ROSI|nr:hypothetical protein J1N35_008901 [Gossypium stocksii]